VPDNNSDSISFLWNFVNVGYTLTGRCYVCKNLRLGYRLNRWRTLSLSFSSQTIDFDNFVLRHGNSCSVHIELPSGNNFIWSISGPKIIKADNARINVTPKRVRVAIFAVKKQQILHTLKV
jgi:hypothetical protein